LKLKRLLRLRISDSLFESGRGAQLRQVLPRLDDPTPSGNADIFVG
jgi:hypothetical protein